MATDKTDSSCSQKAKAKRNTTRNSGLAEARFPVPEHVDPNVWRKKWCSVIDCFGKRKGGGGREALPGLIRDQSVRRETLRRLIKEAEDAQKAAEAKVEAMARAKGRK